MRNAGKMCWILSTFFGGLQYGLFVYFFVLTTACMGACSHKYEYLGVDEVTTLRESLAFFDSDVR